MNGWKNYETWNVSLWMRNEEPYYNVAMASKDYPEFVLKLKAQGIEQTPDGVFFAMKGLDVEALTEAIKELEQ